MLIPISKAQKHILDTYDASKPVDSYQFSIDIDITLNDFVCELTDFLEFIPVICVRAVDGDRQQILPFRSISHHTITSSESVMRPSDYSIQIILKSVGIFIRLSSFVVDANGAHQLKNDLHRYIVLGEEPSYPSYSSMSRVMKYFDTSVNEENRNYWVKYLKTSPDYKKSIRTGTDNFIITRIKLETLECRYRKTVKGTGITFEMYLIFLAMESIQNHYQKITIALYFTLKPSSIFSRLPGQYTNFLPFIIDNISMEKFKETFYSHFMHKDITILDILSDLAIKQSISIAKQFKAISLTFIDRTKNIIDEIGENRNKNFVNEYSIETFESEVIFKLPTSLNMKMNVTKQLYSNSNMSVAKVEIGSNNRVTISELLYEICENSIQESESIFDYGVDSLSVVILCNEINKYSIKKVSIKDIYSLRTPEMIASYAFKDKVKKQSNQRGVKEIVEFYESLYQVSINECLASSKKGGTGIFGASGYLGFSLLQTALQKSKRIVLFNLRMEHQDYLNLIKKKALNYGIPEQVFSSYVEVVTVNNEYELLKSISASGVDSIVNTYANVNFYKCYEDLASDNIKIPLLVGSCSVELGIKFLHVSTLGVFELSERRTLLEEPLPMPTLKNASGYVITKFITDYHLMNRYEDKVDLCCIIRPGWILNLELPNTNDFITQFLLACMELDCHPLLDLNIPFISNTTLANAVFDIVGEPSESIYHFNREYVFSFEGFFRVAKEHRASFNGLPYNEFVLKLSQHNDDKIFVNRIKGLLVEANDMWWGEIDKVFLTFNGSKIVNMDAKELSRSEYDGFYRKLEGLILHA